MSPKEWWQDWEPGTNATTTNKRVDEAPVSVPQNTQGEMEDSNKVIPTALSTQYTDPQSFKEAMACTDGQQWHEAANAEINWHLENKTWDYVELLANAKAIGCKWVSWLKHHAGGSIKCYRSQIGTSTAANDRVVEELK